MTFLHLKQLDFKSIRRSIRCTKIYIKNEKKNPYLLKTIQYRNCPEIFYSKFIQTILNAVPIFLTLVLIMNIFHPSEK